MFEIHPQQLRECLCEVKVNDPKRFNELISDASKEGEVMLLLRDGRTGRIGYIVVPLR